MSHFVQSSRKFHSIHQDRDTREQTRDKIHPKKTKKKGFMPPSHPTSQRSTALKPTLQETLKLSPISQANEVSKVTSKHAPRLAAL